MLICCDETATSEPLQGYIEDCIVTTKMHMAGTRHKCRKRQNSDFYWYGEAVVGPTVLYSYGELPTFLYSLSTVLPRILVSAALGWSSLFAIYCCI